MIRASAGFALLLTAFVAAPVPPAAAANSSLTGVHVARAWARASIGTSRPAAAYVTLVNSGTRPVTLTAVSTSVARRAALHKTVTQGDTMKMMPAGPITIPAGGRLTMKPGGFHIMLMGLKHPITKGETLKLGLRFAKDGTIEVSAPVMGPGAMGPE